MYSTAFAGIRRFSDQHRQWTGSIDPVFVDTRDFDRIYTGDQYYVKLCQHSRALFCSRTEELRACWRGIVPAAWALQS